MQIKRLNILLDRLFLFLLFALIIFGSLGIFKDYSISISLIIVFIFLGVKMVSGQILKIPTNFTLYNIFVFILLLHTLIFNGKIIYFWMFFSGGLFWLSTYNLRGLSIKYLNIFLVFFGFLMLAVFIFLRLKGISYLSPDNLFLPFNPNVIHNHLGDLWSIVVLASIYEVQANKKRQFILSILIGILIIFISFSRSSVLALATGLLYIFGNLNSFKNDSKYLIIIGIVLSLVFIYFGVYKSAFLARPYFYEAILSLPKHPLGVGMGNFNLISQETNVVHNLILEVVSGMGLFAAIFIYWIIKIVYDLLKGDGTNVEAAAIFLAILINFMFDSIYVIPGYFLLWFLILGVTQNRSTNIND